jgi:3'-phosphoadenosine 5'-phosphosulfate sulfotransferase (PAPS reductase)/FAD synthetase
MSDEQLRLPAALDPDGIVAQARDEHSPVATFCLFSGGRDSLAVAHRCREHYDALAFIDTGTAVPGVRDFVVETASWLGKPLRVLEPEDDPYRLLVLGGVDYKGSTWKPLGFPSASHHGSAYYRLKERPLRRLMRDAKQGHPRSARVLCLTGLRRAESARRSSRPAINRRYAMIFANPLIDWTGGDVDRYHREHELPQSDVAALLHRSGECNCGCFASPGERAMLRDLWPEWWESRMGELEREAERLGVPCTWGERRDRAPKEPAGDLCSSCEARLFDDETTP